MNENVPSEFRTNVGIGPGQEYETSMVPLVKDMRT